MPGKYTSDEDKTLFLAWRQEKIPTKVIYELRGRAKSTVIKLLADAKDLSSTEVSKRKFG